MDRGMVMNLVMESVGNALDNAFKEGQAQAGDQGDIVRSAREFLREWDTYRNQMSDGDGMHLSPRSQMDSAADLLRKTLGGEKVYFPSSWGRA